MRQSVWVDGGTRIGEARKALGILGVKDVRFPGWFVENHALNAEYVKMVTDIEAMLLGYDEVYVCLPSFNQDHRVLFDAFITATRPGMTLANLYAYEYPGNSWGPPVPTAGKRYLVASTINAGRKISALEAHETQFKDRFVAVGPQAAALLLAQRGIEIGQPQAELVYVLREVA